MILLLLSTVAPAGADAIDSTSERDAVTQVQEEPINKSANESNTGPEDGNWAGVGNDTENEAEDNGDGLESTMPSTLSVPSADEMLQEAIRWVVEDVQKGIAGQVDGFNFVIVGLPAPGEPDDPATWVQPDNGWWPSVLVVYGISTSLALVILAAATMFAMGMDDIKRQRQFFRRIGTSFIMVIAGFLIMGMMLHLANVTSMALAPSGEEFVDSTTDFADLGLGFVLGAALLKFKLMVIIVGLLVLLMIYFIIHFLAATWPILWAFRSLPIPTLRSYGDLGITSFGLIILLRVTQAFILRFLYEMPWNTAGTGSEVIGLAGTAMGLLVALVGLPYVVLQKATIASAVGLGMGAVPVSSMGNTKRRLKQGASNARSQVNRSRPSSTSTPSTADKQTVTRSAKQPATRRSSSGSGSRSNSSSPTGSPRLVGGPRRPRSQNRARERANRAKKRRRNN